ncbi:hypothetical protein IID24_00145 [Patescibacteria group bacterium]|nr:hypothetical protein [Patescibacteria group bacterium]
MRNPESEPSFELERSIQNEAVEVVLANEVGHRLDMDDFEDVFPPKEIQEDKREVERLKAKFQEELEGLPDEEQERVKQGKKRGEALEIIIGDQAELSDWFGEQAMVTRTTEFDDIRNGVDAVIEFNLEGGAERLALAIDTSTRVVGETMKKKMRRNIEIVTGQRSPLVVKYFRSQVSDFEGTLRGIIPVVIGIERKNADRLSELYAQTTRLEKTKGQAARQLLKEKKEEMGTHPAQMVFLEEVSLQLYLYEDLLEREGSGSEYNIAEIHKMQNLIQRIIDSREKKGISSEGLEDDEFLSMIGDLTDSKTNSENRLRKAA